ncbi:MAG: D-alanine--D-alanine ligase [Actinobacteria bacterium]|nr:D-alanine--D-alanine ligase [Actinomycetota bacterium]
MEKYIAVLMGGRSLEREVSLKSGQKVTDALLRRGYRVVQIDIDENLVDNLLREEVDLAYTALHGKYGEDGVIQELLEILDIPYTGPGVFANIISFDKIISKEMFLQAGIPTPKFFALSSDTFKEMGAASALNHVVKKIGLPLVVKPAAQGSSLGIKIVKSEEELPNALISAFSYGKKVIIEEFIGGTEVAVSILGESKPQALPVVEIVPKSEFFNFKSMYTAGMTNYFVPARLSEEILRKVEETALRTHHALKCTKLSRVDIIVDRDGTPQVLELNTSPGMTETSLLPMAAKAAGMEFDDLVETIVRMSLPV